jgi:hypothetical protein
MTISLTQVAALYDDSGKPSPLMKTCATHFKDRFREILKKLGAPSNAKTKAGSSTDNNGSLMLLEASFSVDAAEDAVKQATALAARLFTPTMKGAGFTFEGVQATSKLFPLKSAGAVCLEVSEAAGQISLKAGMAVLHPDSKSVLKEEAKAPIQNSPPKTKEMAPLNVEGPFPEDKIFNPSTSKIKITAGLPDFVEEVTLGPWDYVTVLLKSPRSYLALSFQSQGGNQPVLANLWWKACVVPAIAFCKKHVLPLVKKGSNPYMTKNLGSLYMGMAAHFPKGSPALYKGYDVVPYQEARDIKLVEAERVTISAGVQTGWGKPYPVEEQVQHGLLVGSAFMPTNESLSNLVSKYQTDWPSGKFPQIMVDVKAKRITFHTNQVQELYPSLLTDKTILSGKASLLILQDLVKRADINKAKAKEKAKADKEKADKQLAQKTKGLTAADVDATLRSSGFFDTYNWDFDEAEGNWTLAPKFGRNREGYWDDYREEYRSEFLEGWFNDLDKFLADNFGKRVDWEEAEKGWISVYMTRR